ncbi:hypothetical protein P278_23300 [Zhouia amylolytica AD3]|uniref:Uncharacterized protein n=1 Tax=Zhouia amylolytica AD3 TaxID=1286632 RepID=W2UK65_9FLAO|nr:hypothetical protein P278_23300 [Zhouia amylolytica AD3]
MKNLTGLEIHQLFQDNRIRSKDSLFYRKVRLNISIEEGLFI